MAKCWEHSLVDNGTSPCNRVVWATSERNGVSLGYVRSMPQMTKKNVLSFGIGLQPSLMFLGSLGGTLI